MQPMQLICQHSCCKNMLNGHYNSHLVIRPIINYRIFQNANINVFWVSLVTQTLPIIVFYLLNIACHCVITFLVRNLFNAFNFLKKTHMPKLVPIPNTCWSFFAKTLKKHAPFEFSWNSKKFILFELFHTKISQNIFHV